MATKNIHMINSLAGGLSSRGNALLPNIIMCILCLTLSSGKDAEWQGLIRVDGLSYNWMGAYQGPELVRQTGVTHAAAKSTFTFLVEDKVNMIVVFLSPRLNNDIKGHSCPLFYVDILVSSADNFDHEVQLYMDIPHGWSLCSQDRITY